MSEMDAIVRKHLRRYGGGEKYFTAIDATLARNELVLHEFFTGLPQGVHFVASGKFGNMFARLFPTTVVPGGLRTGASPGNLCHLAQQNVVFVDDSFYSGATRRIISDELARHGARISATYVMYDGSPVLDPTVKSLFRYYEDVPG